jgi:large subunit ribosomal protein L3
MTTIFDPDGNAVPASLLEIGPCVVLQVKNEKTDGYNAVQLGFDEKRPKSTTKAQLAHFAKAGTTPKRFVMEIRIPKDDKTEFKAGQVIKTEEIFTVGDFVDVIGTTRGRGFQGVMKRWGMHGSDAAHGTHEYFRHGGSIGTHTKIARTLKGLKMPGQYGNEQVTMQNLKIIELHPEQNLVLVKGSVPGVKNNYLVLRIAKKKKRKPPVEKKTAAA